MIAFLHTLQSNVDKFDTIAQKYAANRSIKHFVNETLLTNALNTGKSDCEGFRAEIEAIRKLNPELIICTCSSYGEACDRRIDVERIDEPIVKYIVANFKKIGLAYAATSTRSVSADLIRTTATVMDKEVDIIDIDCSEAWPYFQQKDFDQYAKQIAKTVKAQASQVEVIFLAQASMEDAKLHLDDLNIEVLSSPEYGVKSYLS